MAVVGSIWQQWVPHSSDRDLITGVGVSEQWWGSNSRRGCRIAVVVIFSQSLIEEMNRCQISDICTCGSADVDAESYFDILGCEGRYLVRHLRGCECGYFTVQILNNNG